MSRTTISVSRETCEMLKNYGKKGEDYDTILRRLMALHEEMDLDAYIEEQWRRATEDRDKFVSLDEYEKSRGLK
jgi:hypothetical protein